MTQNFKFNKRLNQLLSFDEIRKLKLLEMFQYTVIYFVLVIIISYVLNNFYFKDNKKKRPKTTANFIRLSALIILETFLIIVIIFYIRKVALLVPSIGTIYHKNFVPHTTLDYLLHIAVVYVFLELLPGYKYKFEHLLEYID
tara:strand:+ start:320 stop:745 length:426 start_codon:yes stop_codon:yes gene_type:complete